MIFSQSVIEHLGYYVYLLKDPRNNEVFYVGKGLGNRVLNHVNDALDTIEESDKLRRIRQIIDSGFSVEHIILRHGLDEVSAFEIEASVIDYIGLETLSNDVSGHYSSDYGIKTLDEIQAIYEAKPLNTECPLILININRKYRRDMTVDALYEATRFAWVIGERRNKAKYVVATYRG